MSDPHLKVLDGPEQGRSVRLKKHTPLVVGRNPHVVGLHVSDAMVSNQHFKVYWKSGNFWLEDCGSTNGTYLNKQKVKSATVLRPGVEVQSGQTRFVLILYEGHSLPSDGRARQHAVEVAWLLEAELSQRASAQPSMSDLIQRDLRLPPGLRARLKVQQGPDQGKSFPLRRGSVRIGRRSGGTHPVEVGLNDPEVSRFHAIVEIFGYDMIFVRDELHSLNGTYHNTRRIQAARLASGDRIGMGQSVLLFEIG